MSLQVVDARSKGRFLGTDREPRATLPSGHMNGAKNIPYTEVINPESKILKSKHELQEGMRTHTRAHSQGRIGGIVW